jgi:hypothetical protein
MLKSVAGKYKDVVCMTPIQDLTANKLLLVWRNVVKVLTEIEFDVVVTVVDGLRANVCFYDKLVEPSMRATHKLVIKNPFALFISHLIQPLYLRISTTTLIQF